MPTLETQVVDIADEIAYDNHDLDDGLTSGLFKERDLQKLPIWKLVCAKFPRSFRGLDDEKRKYLIIRSLINLQVTDLIQMTQATIARRKIKNCTDVKRWDAPIVRFSPKVAALREPLRDFLKEKMYNHYRVVRMSDKAKRFIREMFEVYNNKPRELPPKIQLRIAADGKQRAICDYIAGMTDRYALDEYKKLFDPYEKV